MMPIMDGFTVLEKVKANPETRNIPIIVISANSDLQSTVKGIQLGAEDYLPKPFEPTLLQARIQSSLEKKRLRDIQDLYLKSLENELTIARDIQKEFLPAELPQIAGWEIASYFTAAKNVAGDFYDAFTLPDGNLICVVGDVCGKGVGAALYMTLFRSLIRATSTYSDFALNNEKLSTSPATRLLHTASFTNKYITQIHEESFMFATAFICLINIQNGSLSYINAGNDLPYLLRSNGTIEELGTTGPAIGVIQDAKFTVRETRLELGDFLLAFTDGIPDCQNSQEEFYGRNRIVEFM
ncbi:MAG: SpoIIE family protein phosphatase, partial [Anaerolineales bacterium]|nr:SpoIIE family protein phosphatase [Anaerolineales bacterium]